jgi:hypothetical protein
VVLQKLESGRMWILRSQQIMPIWLSQKVVEPWTSIFRSWLSFSGMLTCSTSHLLRHSWFLVLYICLVTWAFTILKDSYLIQKALEVRVCSYVWG